MPQLRTYQQRAVNAIYEHLRTRDDNPCVVIPTAGGKSWVIAQVCSDAVKLWDGKVMVLAHVKELLEQNADKIRKLAPDVGVGLYSAGLKSRQTLTPVVVAGIQSAYRRPDEFQTPNLIIVDEAHLIPEYGEGMYRAFLGAMRERNPNVRVIGLTATPFRMTTGPICTPENMLNHVCFQVGVRDLIIQGYLSKLTTRAGKNKPNTDRLHIRAGEFIAEEAEQLMMGSSVLRDACAEIIERTQDRKSVLLFAAGVDHAKELQRTMRKMGVQAEIILGETRSNERDAIIEWFRAGSLKYLINVGVLTHGFDVPRIDCVALLRPTMSPGLFYQMTGRGFRICEGKEDCLVLDYGNNVLRHGPVDSVIAFGRASEGMGPAPWKECPECHSIIAAGYGICPECGHGFPEREGSSGIEGKASDGSILSGEATEYDVMQVSYHLHYKRGDEEAPRTMRVEYYINYIKKISEWVCFEHTGYPLSKAKKWWAKRSNAPFPEDSEEAVMLANAGALAPVLKITARKDASGFDRIIKYEMGEIPSWRNPGEDEEQEAEVYDTSWYPPEDDIPF